MPRIPHKPLDSAGPENIVAPIRTRRGGTLLSIDRQMLYSPPLAEGWNHLLGAVRTKFSLPGRLREIAICCVAVLNGAPYEFHHHAPLLVKEGGTQAQADALRDVAAALKRADLFNEAELAAIRLTFEMTRCVMVSDATFQQAAAALGTDQHMIELVATIAAYNMVSRFIVALEIDPE